MRRRAFVVTALGSLSCARAPQQGETAVKIAIGGAAQVVYLPATLAQQLGFYREEGLNVTLLDFPAGANALQEMLNGKADVLCGFYDHAIQMAAEGRRVTAFVNMLRYPGLALVVSPKAKKPIRRIEDLTDSTAGITAPGSSTQFFLNYLLAKRNVSRERVAIASIGHGATAIAAVDSGWVDVAVLTDPAIANLQQRYANLTILADVRTASGVREHLGVAQYPGTVLSAPAEWIEKNQSTVQRLARAMRKTLHWINSHSARQLAEKMPSVHRGSDITLYETALIESMTIFNPNGALALEDAEAVRKLLGYSLPSVRTANIDLKTTFTNEFLQDS